MVKAADGRAAEALDGAMISEFPSPYHGVLSHDSVAEMMQPAHAAALPTILKYGMVTRCRVPVEGGKLLHAPHTKATASELTKRTC